MTQEKRKPIMMVYRDNDAYSKYMPQLVKKLKDEGYEVELKIFPRETEEKDISAWANENKAQFVGKEVTSDGTLLRALKSTNKSTNGGYVYYPLETFKEEFNCDWQGLDQYLDSAVRTILERKLESEVFGSKYEHKDIGTDKDNNGQEDPKIASDIFQNLIRYVVKKTGLPEKVLVAPHCLTDHAPYSEEYKNKTERKSVIDSQAAEEIRADLIRAGIPGERITLSLNQGETASWVIRDRHNRVIYSCLNFETNPNALDLPLPLPNAFNYLIKRGLIELEKGDDEQIVETIERNISGVIARIYEKRKEKEQK